MAMIDLFVFGGGLALGVYFHDWIVSKIQGGEAFANNMKAKAAAVESQLQAKANAVKAAVK